MTKKYLQHNRIHKSIQGLSCKSINYKANMLTGIPSKSGSTGALKGCAASDFIIILITYTKDNDHICITLVSDNL